MTDLTGNAKFPDSPDMVTYPNYFELYATGTIATPPAGDVYGNSGAQMIGYFYPPSTGDYVFYIGADDGANLYLSTDPTAANKKLIAQEAGWSGVRAFTTIGGGSTVEAKCSQTFTGTAWPTKDPVNGGAKITLTKGQAYYIEALQKEGGGGDNLAVAVSDPGGAIDYNLPIPGEYLSSIDKQSGPVTIVTQPQSQTVNEGQPVTFSIVVNGTPPYTYDWRKNGTVFATTTDPVFTIPRVYRADNGAKYSIVVTGAQGPAVTSAEAVLTVVNDTAGPTLVLAGGGATFDTATITFSEPLDPASATTAANYKIDGGVTVSAAALAALAGTAGDNQVILTTSKQTEGVIYTITVNNVKDVPGNAIAANSTIQMKSFKFMPGWASYQRWHNENGDPGDINAFATAIADGSIRAPDYSSAVQQFGGPWGARDNYSGRVFAWFTPPDDGDYAFFVGSDDGSRVYLSTDDKPANKKLIAQESAWSNQYQFTTSGGGSALEDKRSDQFGATEWPNFNTITLKKNTKYYLEVLWDEGGGGDGADVTFIKAGQADPSNDAAGMRLKGNVIATYLDPTGASITISEQPKDTTQQEERTAEFTVVATGNSAYGSNVTYQWQSMAPGAATWADIAGATRASYITSILKLSDTGTKYRVICSVPTVTEVSAAATLTVVADTFAPKVVGAGAINRKTAIEIGVGFDENVDEVSASTVANYTLSKGSVTGVRYQKFDHTDGAPFFQLGTAGPFRGAAVVLTTTGLAGGDNVTVTAKNIKDVKGNTMAAAGEAKSLTVTKKMKYAFIGGTDYLEGELGGQNINPDPALWPEDVVAYSESDFDLISSGTANWNNYDEATFVYEEVTGDFDKVVRVEYHDPTSQWARAGLCATPDPDEGMNRAAVGGGAMMERRFMQRANPAVQWNGAAGNNQYEADWRLTKGGNYGGAGASNPAYPNAWMRMVRSGQIFTAFYSNDGTTWTQYGTTTFTDEPMPAKLLVGPYYSPEFGNNTTGEGVGHSAVAKFRQYGSFQSKPSEVDFAIGMNFGADEYTSSNAGMLSSIATAGVPGVVQANWNNLTLLSGSAAGLVADSKGVAQPTGVTVEWASANTWSSTGRGEENNALPGNDKILMTGYLDTGDPSTTTVKITGLPDLLYGNGYDVYVYSLGGVEARGGGYHILGADGTEIKPYVDTQSPMDPTNYVEAVPTPGSWAIGNYLVFKGLKGQNAKDITVEATTALGHRFGGTARAPINAVQLVPAKATPTECTIAYVFDPPDTLCLNWACDKGDLYSAPTVLGPWTAVNSAGTPSPYCTKTTETMRFFSIRLGP